MKIFVDLKNSYTGWRFAWFDTILDKFETHSGNQVWDTWEDFERDYEGVDLDRYMGLAQDCAFDTE